MQIENLPPNSVIYLAIDDSDLQCHGGIKQRVAEEGWRRLPGMVNYGLESVLVVYARKLKEKESEIDFWTSSEWVGFAAFQKQVEHLSPRESENASNSPRTADDVDFSPKPRKPVHGILKLPAAQGDGDAGLEDSEAIVEDGIAFQDEMSSQPKEFDELSISDVPSASESNASFRVAVLHGRPRAERPPAITNSGKETDDLSDTEEMPFRENASSLSSTDSLLLDLDRKKIEQIDISREWPREPLGRLPAVPETVEQTAAAIDDLPEPLARNLHTSADKTLRKHHEHHHHTAHESLDRRRQIEELRASIDEDM